MKRITCAMVLSAAAVQMVSMSAQAAPAVGLLAPGKLAGTVKIVGSIIPGTNLPSVGTLGQLSINAGLKSLPPVILVKRLRVPAAIGNVTVADALAGVESTRLAQTALPGVGKLNVELLPVAAYAIKFESKLP